MIVGVSEGECEWLEVSRDEFWRVWMSGMPFPPPFRCFGVNAKKSIFKQKKIFNRTNLP